MRILILNDDSHDNVYCFENGLKANLEEVLDTLTPAHTVNYEHKILYLPDAIDSVKLDCRHEKEEEEMEDEVVEFFSYLMFERSENNYEKYLYRFETLWRLAE